MKSKLVYGYFFLFFLQIFSCTKKSIAQKHNNYIVEDYKESIWVPSKNEESFIYPVNDTISKYINIIFELNFDDSININIDNRNIFRSKIKTEKNLSVVNEIFKIKLGDYLNPKIEIHLIEKKKKIIFQPKANYSIFYISRIQNIWFIEYSNHQRIYY